MAKGYIIAHVSITDPERYPAYVAANAAAFEKYGATFKVRGGKYEALEGKTRDRHVVIEFDSFEKARRSNAITRRNTQPRLKSANPVRNPMSLSLRGTTREARHHGGGRPHGSGAYPNRSRNRWL